VQEEAQRCRPDEGQEGEVEGRVGQEEEAGGEGGEPTYSEISSPESAER